MEPHSDLSPLQRDVLKAFFEREREFFLTGGAALTGYHLHHRTTDDLDLFALEMATFERGPYVIKDVARALGAELSVRQDAPGFKRYTLKRHDEVLVVDLVLDQVKQVHAEKPEYAGVRVDPPDEILANKLTALVARSEERDLVDVLFLERAGYRVEDALAKALAKDGGCTGDAGVAPLRARDSRWLDSARENYARRTSRLPQGSRGSAPPGGGSSPQMSV
ncbi:nucleotidyl transferase AbiEii/AbiGii toxin family protein [Pendulispora albinea]|uniref:Nucleotidyl transferase AbiEii/AbiGii toxin family protein n=1 Tax=Pendulispora albinea TaxID=2741071 RepID=A0ABZ2LWW5_9BACT